MHSKDSSNELVSGKHANTLEALANTRRTTVVNCAKDSFLKAAVTGGEY